MSRPPSSAEVAVLGLGKSGASVARLLAREGRRVYVSDSGTGEALVEAASRLSGEGISVELGRHDMDRIRRAPLVVASPGIPPGAAPLVEARAHGVPVVGELEIALRHLGGLRYIAITGTNGKTTTTALVAHLLSALGHDVVSAGNIGTPLAEIALREKCPDWVALEVSSFQLHDTPSLAPTVGVVTNLSPDHLDRYASVEEYYGDKAMLFANASPDSRWVLNADDGGVLTLHQRAPSLAGRGLPGTTFQFSVQREADAWYARREDALRVSGQHWMSRASVPLLGDHNVANTLAAVLAVTVADTAHGTPDARGLLAEAVESFVPPPHRLELVGEPGGVQWINDSKATNVSSTLVALEGMKRPYVLLLGGRHKGEPYTALAEPFRRHGKTVLAYGEAGPTVEADLGELVPVERLGSSFPAVIARARQLTSPGDAVLLSPACSSYDMFRNYEHRGAEFRRLAMDQSA